MTLLQSAGRSAYAHHSLRQLGAAVLLDCGCQTTEVAFSGASQVGQGLPLSLQRVSNNPSNSIRRISSSTGSTAGASSESTPQSSQQPSSAVREPSIKQLRAEIFEQHIGDGRRSGRKAILKPLKGRIVADWYFTLTGPKMHMFDDPLEEERTLKVQVARATGAGPPKKGQGKRAGKKK